MSNPKPTSDVPALPTADPQAFDHAPIGAATSPSSSRSTWLDRVNTRVDHALAENHRAERLIVSMALALFIVGLLLLFLGYWLRNPIVASAALLSQIFLMFPINEIRKLRRDNLILQTFPVLIEGLPKEAALQEIKKLLAYLRGGQ